MNSMSQYFSAKNVIRFNKEGKYQIQPAVGRFLELYQNSHSKHELETAALKKTT